MSTVTISNSPFHATSVITRVYGYVSSSYSCGYHTGVDLVSQGDLTIYPPYAGQVTQVNNTPSASLGVNVQIRDGAGRYWRFCHMVSGSVQVSNGQNVTTATPIGTMGATGNVTGPHLHLECSTGVAWQCGTFINPCGILGIPNEVGTVVQYDGTTPPPTPTAEWIYHASSNTQSEMENNAICVINFYRRAGMDDRSIAAILGNMQAESTIQPWLTEAGGGGGYGLVQWTPKSSLINHASILGLSNYNDGDVQCYTIVREMIGDPSSILEWYSSQAFISHYYNSGATQDMIGVTGLDFYHNTMSWTSDKLAVLFMAAYERPSYDPSVNHSAARQQYAIDWYIFMGGIAPPTPVPPPAPTGNGQKFPWVLFSRKFREKGKRKRL